MTKYTTRKGIKKGSSIISLVATLAICLIPTLLLAHNAQTTFILNPSNPFGTNVAPTLTPGYGLYQRQQEIDAQRQLRQLQLERFKIDHAKQKAAEEAKTKKARSDRLKALTQACNSTNLSTADFNVRSTCQAVKWHQKYGTDLPNSQIGLP